MDVIRLGPGDEVRTREMLAMMAEVFDEPSDVLGDDYLRRLLARSDFWAVAAIENDLVVGGVTAHTLAMTRRECAELFIYDVAVRSDRQRRGIGRALITFVLARAATEGIDVSFVPADDEDVHAIDFYRALGGAASPVTIFTFSRDD